jgi:hypothetical protein
MHHSSIKEHLAKIHPGSIHSSSNPAYVFNSGVVPEPEQFNSVNFDRQAFITEAREANDKLIAQINYQQNSSLSPTSSINSLSFNHKNDNDSSFINDVQLSPSSSSSLNCSDFEQDPVQSSPLYKPQTTTTTTPTSTKYTSFSINSIINDNNQTSTCQTSSMPLLSYTQMQMFYAYAFMLQLQNQNKSL